MNLHHVSYLVQFRKQKRSSVCYADVLCTDLQSKSEKAVAPTQNQPRTFLYYPTEYSYVLSVYVSLVVRPTMKERRRHPPDDEKAAYQYEQWRQAQLEQQWNPNGTDPEPDFPTKIFEDPYIHPQ